MIKKTFEVENDFNTKKTKTVTYLNTRVEKLFGFEKFFEIFKNT